MELFGHSLHSSEPWQPLATQLPGPRLQDNFVTGPFIIDGPTARQHGQILGEVLEPQSDFNLETASGQFNHSDGNQCIYPYAETSMFENGLRDTDFSAPLDDVLQVASIVPEVGSIPQVWSSALGSSPSSYIPLPQSVLALQPRMSEFDPSPYFDPCQQQHLSSLNAGPFHNDLISYPTQPGSCFDAATSLGSSSRNTPGIWTDSNQMYQIGSLGPPSYQRIDHSDLDLGYDYLSTSLSTRTPSSLGTLLRGADVTASDNMISPAQVQSLILPKTTTKRQRETECLASYEQQNSGPSILPRPIGKMEDIFEPQTYEHTADGVKPPSKKRKPCESFRKVKNACFLCKLKKRPCVVRNTGLCHECVNLVARVYGKHFQLPRSRCDEKNSMANLPLFTTTLPSLNAKICNTAFNGFPNRDAICILRLLKPMLAILDDMEPTHLRRKIEHTSIAYYSYCQSVVRWKRLLNHLVPSATELLDVLEILHRVLLRHILDRFDSIQSGTDPFSTLGAISLVSDELPSLRLCESVNQAAVEHLENYLNHRKLVLASVLATTQSVSKRTWQRQARHEVKLSGPFAEAPEYFPPGHCKNRWDTHGNNEAGCPDCLQPPVLNVQPTPLQYTQAKPTCPSSTIICSLPPHVLALLDIDMESLFKQIPNTEQPILRRMRHLLEGYGEVQHRFFAEMFRQAMCITLMSYFDAMAMRMRSDDWRINDFGDTAQEKFRVIERHVEGPMLIAAFVQMSSKLLEQFLRTKRESELLDSKHSEGKSMRDWFEKSRDSKMAREQLQESVNYLARHPIRVVLVETGEKKVDITIYIEALTRLTLTGPRRAPHLQSKEDL